MNRTEQEKISDLIEWIGSNGWRESVFTNPAQTAHVPMYPLLDEIKRIFTLSPEQIDVALVRGQH